MLTLFLRGASLLLIPSVSMGLAQAPWSGPSTVGDHSTGIIGSGDFDGDGYLDLAFSRNGAFQWYAGPDYDGDVDQYEIGPGSGNSYGGTCADMNGDGWNDLIASDGAAGSGPGSLWLFLHPGSAGAATDSWTRITIYTQDVWHQNDLKVADLDGDGRLDVVVRTRSDERRLLVALQNADLETWTTRAWPTGETSNGPEGLSLGDIDNDGEVEIVLSGVWWDNPGGWRTGEPMEYSLDPAFVGLAVKSAVGDLDGDGQADDIVMCKAEGSGSNSKLSWYRHDGNPTSGAGAWTETQLQSAVTNMHTLEVGDLDLDGHLDILAGKSFGSSGLFAYYGSQGGVEWAEQVISAGDTMYVTTLADVDADGDLDFAGPKKWQGAVELWRNELLDGASTPPAAPSELAAVGLTATAVQLTWTDNSTNESGFQLERRTAAGLFALVAAPPLNAEAFVDGALAPSTDYVYRLRATNGAGQSAWSDEVLVTTLDPDVTPPTPPSGLTLVQAGSASAELAWQASTDDQGVAGYRLYSDGLLALELGAVELQALLTGLMPETSYLMFVTAFDGSGNESGASETVLVTTEAPPDLGDSVLGYWKLDQSAGSTAVDETGLWNGALSGGATWRPGGGVLGGALELFGGGDRVQVGALDSDGGLPALTLAAWVRPQSWQGTAAEARFVSKAAGTSSEQHAWMLGNFSGGTALRGRLTTTGSGTVTALSSAGVLALDTWSHVALVFDGASVRLYLDAVEVAASPATGAVAPNPGMDLALGNQPEGAGERGLIGLLDDVVVLGAALTPDELGLLASGQLFSSPSPVQPSCLCPAGVCGNADALAGCANSTGQGAVLEGFGSSSVAADDLRIELGHLPPGQFALLFIGDALVAPTPVGAGLRCVGGGLSRFAPAPVDAAGLATYGPGLIATAAALPVAVQILPGSTWHFQAWYRDPVGSPCGETFGLTHAGTVTFR